MFLKICEKRHLRPAVNKGTQCGVGQAALLGGTSQSLSEFNYADLKQMDHVDGFSPHVAGLGVKVISLRKNAF